MTIAHGMTNLRRRLGELLDAHGFEITYFSYSDGSGVGGTLSVLAQEAKQADGNGEAPPPPSADYAIGLVEYAGGD